MKKRIGKRTIRLNNMPTIVAASSIVGPKEGQGPLKDKFDLVNWYFERIADKTLYDIFQTTPLSRT